ncbi:MAG: phage tail protein [Burkholderiaceae bacterium]
MDGLSVNVRTNAHSIAFELMASAQEMRNTALVRSLNKMADQVLVASSREVRSAGYGLKAADIKRALRVKRASQSQLTATVIASGRPIPLIQYGARQTAKGVTVNVLNGRKLIPGAFIATMPTGHRGVFVLQPGGKHKKVQKGGKASWHQLPIRELYGPAIPDALANQAVRDVVQELITVKFPVILEHEHAWLAKRLKARQ